MPYKDPAKKRSASRKYSQEYNARPALNSEDILDQAKAYLKARQ